MAEDKYSVAGKKYRYRYSISGVVNLYGRLDAHGSFVIYFVNPCHRILVLTHHSSTSTDR